MKTAILLTLFPALMLAAGGAVPRKAPEFRIQTGPQKFIRLSQYTGKTVVLAFVLTDCTHCQATTKVLNDIQKDYAIRGVQVLETALDQAAPLRIADFRRVLKTVFPVGYNTPDEAVKFMGYPPGAPVLMPVIVFIDRYGIIRAQFDSEDKAMQNQDKNLRLTLDQGMTPGEKKTP
jgi:peroxiredoxin